MFIEILRFDTRQRKKLSFPFRYRPGMCGFSQRHSCQAGVDMAGTLVGMYLVFAIGLALSQTGVLLGVTIKKLYRWTTPLKA